MLKIYIKYDSSVYYDLGLFIFKLDLNKSGWFTLKGQVEISQQIIAEARHALWTIRLHGQSYLF